MTTAIDPICGMPVSTSSQLRSSRGGETFYFCGASCKARFDAAETPASVALAKDPNQNHRDTARPTATRTKNPTTETPRTRRKAVFQNLLLRALGASVLLTSGFFSRREDSGGWEEGRRLPRRHREHGERFLKNCLSPCPQCLCGKGLVWLRLCRAVVIASPWSEENAASARPANR